MAIPKLFKVIHALDKTEMSAFNQYLSARLTVDSALYELHNALRTNKSELLDPGMLEKLQQQAFPKSHTKAFLNLCSRLFKHLESWLAQHQLSKELYKEQILLSKYYNRKGLYKLADQCIQRLENQITADAQHAIEKARALADIKYYHYYSDNPVKYRRGHQILEDLADQHLKAFKEMSLLLIAELYNWGSIQNHDFRKHIHLLKLAIISIPETKTSFYLEQLIHLVDAYSVDAYLTLLNLVKKSELKANTDLETLISLYLVSYSVKLWSRKNISEPELVVEAHHLALENGALMTGGKIPHVRFHNIVNTLSFIMTYDLVDDFIDRWTTKVRCRDPESTKLLAQAQNCFYHQRYADILLLTRSIQFEDITQKIRALGIESIALFETDEDELQLYLHLLNFERLLRRNKSKTDRRDYFSHMNLIKIIRKLNKSRYKTTKLSLEDYEPIIYKDYLSKKIKQTH